MTIWSLVKKEIKYHKLAFTLCLLSVIVATGVFAGELTVLKAHDIKTDSILAEKEMQTEDEMEQMEAYYRRIMEEHGCNLLILPKGQNLNNFYAEGYASKFMPEEYMDQLAESDILSIAHLVPVIEQKMRWQEEYNRTILLLGTRYEMPSVEGATRSRLPAKVAPGRIVLGYELWDSLNPEVGDTVKLLGATFEVEGHQPQRGTKEDITVWMDLDHAQRLLGRDDQINAIQAVQTYSTDPDFSSLRDDITRILPDTQVVILENEATTLAKTINRAKKTAEFSLAREQEDRSKLRVEMETFASWLIPLVSIASMMLIVLLTLANARERSYEIAILRTLGYRSRQIWSLFLTKALLIGVIGATIGYIIGFLAAAALGTGSGSGSGPETIASLFDARILVIALVAAPGMSLLASLAPAMVAARRDPADILRAG
ncbi:MAG: FtsX-like permease family protein [Euryarchaeota archaeon]|nr:FtsX-like permease family protein [Euryarchaeota archaeon]